MKIAPIFAFMLALLGAAACNTEPAETQSHQAELALPGNIKSFDYCAAIARDPELLARTRAKLDSFGQTYRPEYNDIHLFHTGLKLAAELPAQDCARVFGYARAHYKQQYEDNWLAYAGPFGEGRTEHLSDDTNVAAVQMNLIDLGLDDQATRATWQNFSLAKEALVTLGWGEALASYEMGEADEASIQYMKTLLQSESWVTQDKYGETASHIAWLLVQHADHDTALQKLALDRIAPHIESGVVDKPDYAYLADRVRVNSGLPQLHGTQITGKCVDGIAELHPIAGRDNLNTRRAKMGLGPVEAYVNRMSSLICAQ